MDIKEEGILGDGVSENWYYRSKALALLRCVGETGFSSILDVGAGSGFFSKYLLDKTSASKAVCVDTSYASESDGVFAGKSMQYRTGINVSDANLVLMMDVLEHVDDDAGLLQHYIAKVKPGTRFLITVPAFSFLWSQHDVFLEHKRRYTLREMEQVLEASGLQLEHGSYFYGLVFPLAMITRMLDRLLNKNTAEPRSQMKPSSKFINGLLYNICKLDLLVFRINRLAGLTVFCLAKKA